MRTGKLGIALAFTLIAPGLSNGQTTLNLPGAVGGYVASTDDKTLILSIPSSGLLLFYDAVADKEIKRVEVDFQPAALALQGKTLFAASKGSAVVHVLDALTGKELKELKIQGEPVTNLACHPTKGLLYAANTSYAIFSIDPMSGKVTPTQAKGEMLAMGGVEGNLLYAGIQKPRREVLLMKPGPGRSVLFSVANANRFGLMLKYLVKGSDLELVGANDNGAINGIRMGVSPDGKRIAMAGGGGWSAANQSRRSYSIAIFDTADMKTLLGQVDLGPYPCCIAFHPYLNLGAAGRYGNQAGIVLFNAKSLVKKGDPILTKPGSPNFVLFGGQGTKLIFGSSQLGGKDVTLHVHSLPLTDQDRDTLKKAYINN